MDILIINLNILSDFEMNVQKAMYLSKYLILKKIKISNNYFSFRNAYTHSKDKGLIVKIIVEFFLE